MEHRLCCNRSTTRMWVATLLLMLVVGSSNSLMAQNPTKEFALSLGDSSADQANAVAVDDNGNIYVTGYFNRTVDFDPGPGTHLLTQIHTGTAYVASYTSTGALRWAFRLGGVGPGPGFNAYANAGLAIAVDGAGDVVVMGYYSGSADFDPGPSTTTLTARTGTVDMFLVKYSPAGNMRWAFSLPVWVASRPYPPGKHGAHCLAIDSRDNILVGGTFYGKVDFDPSTRGRAELTGPALGSGEDLFVARFTSAGAYSWAFRLGTSGYENVHGIATDGSDNVIVTGVFSNTMNFNPAKGTAVNVTPSNPTDIFVAKYSPAAKVRWAFSVGSSGVDCPNGIATDAGNNIVITGYHQNTIDLHPGTGVSIVPATDSSSQTGQNMYLAKYDSTGGHVWSFGTGVGSGASLDIEENGDIVVTGSIRGTADFDPTAGTAYVSSSPSIYVNCFLARYSSSGAYEYAFGMPGSPSGAGSVALDGNGNTHVTGFFGVIGGSTYFDPADPSDSLTSNGSYDLFIAKYNDASMPKRTLGESAAADDVALHAAPNPFTGEFTLGLAGASAPWHVRIVDMTGHLVETKEIAEPALAVTLGADLAAGTYVVQITHGATRRQMVVHKTK